MLSNAYLILRPFFRAKETLVSDDPLEPNNWEFGELSVGNIVINSLPSVPDISTPDFPGIFAGDKGFFGPRLTHASHPHMRLEESMTSVPTVSPGDMVFWHCDVVHSVEQEHMGQNDSSGLPF